MPRILGIDPGLTKTGWGILDYQNRSLQKGSLQYVASGLIKPDASLNLAVRLKFIADGLRQVIDLYKPDICALEETFVNKNAMSSLKLGHARGAIMLAVSLAGLEIHEYAATLVKKSVTGAGRAEKNQVAIMVKMLMPQAQLNSEDEADAMAVAICHTSNANYKMVS